MIQKPSFPNPSTTLTKAALQKLEGLVESAKTPEGAVDVAALKQKVLATGDVTLQDGLRAITDAFQRVETTTYSGSCGGSRSTRLQPKSLAASEVMSVLGALVEARSKVDQADTNHDGKLQADEAKSVEGLSGLSGELAQVAVAAELKSYRLELRKWSDALGQVASSIDNRSRVDKEIVRAADHHAATPAGREAITWAYRDLATVGHGLDVWDMREALEAAESSFLKYIPFFGRSVKTAAGHLSDGEVRDMFSTSDLASFAAEKRAAVEARVKMSYGDYVLGKDLEGHEQVSDPDFKKSYSASC
ncbi:MAG: hypothetical protein HYV07_16900 [Deltaproteobacteria bacterium]|nr:hypothetical protein [Deltaproteobacteria bacterium]